MQEEDLRSGLLLEQGALCLLRARPPRLRRFAFHLTLAGLRFNACEQKALGARAYRWAVWAERTQGLLATRIAWIAVKRIHLITHAVCRNSRDLETS